MASSSKFNKLYNIRSISLPCRSHPSTVRIDEELSKVKTWEAASTPTADAICNGLSGLQALYECLDDLYNLPVTQQALSRHQHERWTEELLDKSMRLLDICGITRDVVSQMKEHVRDVQSVFRRRKGDLRIESSVAKYTSSRKKMKNDAKKMIAALKHMDSKVEASPMLDADHHMASLIRVLREVNVVSISVFHALLLFLSVPISKPVTARWSSVSKLLHKDENVNEFGSVDMALNVLSRYGLNEGEKMQIAQKSFEALEASIEVIENGSGCLFRRLIKARASLLNIVSQ